MTNFSNRKYLIGSIFVFIMIVFLVRLFNLQIIDDSYKFFAESNSQRQVTQYPARGLIYDRNGELLVYNQAAYDLMIVPHQVQAFDTADLCNVLKINRSELVANINKAKAYSRYKASIFLKQLSSERYAILQEKLHKFPGFFVQPRPLRKYPRKSAAHVLGYLQEVDEQDIQRDPYFKQGDFIGKNGVERFYETILRGRKGVKVFLVDVHNRLMGSYKNGKYDQNAIAGQNLHITLDVELQEYGEKLMQNKKGGIVAIEPSTGEILAMISSPEYDPEMLVGRNRGKNYQKLVQNDSLKPLFNRSLMAQYAPGSIFKIMNSLIGLQEGIIEPHSRFTCRGRYKAGRFTMNCHIHKSRLDLRQAIQHSCNTYFANMYRNLLDHPKYGSVQKGFTIWQNHLQSFGFGEKLGSDFFNELSGFLPSSEYYSKQYKTTDWKSLNVVSLAIGQGELLTTPLQMANMAAIIANKGYYYVPHIIKPSGNNIPVDSTYFRPRYTTIDSAHFNPVIDGMELVVSGGEGSTGILAGIEGIRVCGKTGTVENPHGDDHSVFVAFAPRENPKIAIVVYVENGIWGARYGAPISGLMIEKYLKGKIPENKKWLENRMLKADLIHMEKEKTDDAKTVRVAEK